MAGRTLGVGRELKRGGGPIASRRALLAALAAALAGGGVGAGRALASGDAPLNIGLVPYLSTRQMLGAFEPIREHLQRELGRGVRFYTAASFSALMANARSPDQPFTLMPMHLAQVAIEDWGFQWVVRSTMRSVVQLWASGADSAPLTDAAALRGRHVAIGDPLSVVTLKFQRWCDDNDLAQSVMTTTYPSLGAALKAQQRGEVDYVLAPQAGLRDALAGTDATVQPVLQLGSVLTPGFVASPAARPEEIEALRTALLGLRVPAPGDGGGASTARYTLFEPADAEPYRRHAIEARRLLAVAGVR